MNPQLSALKYTRDNIKDIIPDDKKNKYNLIVGSHILGTYDTLKE